MQDFTLFIKYGNINDFKKYKNNTRKHSALDIEAIKDSILTFGFLDPIAVWGEDNIIVEGHGRLEAAKELGIQQIPYIRLDHLTDEQRKAYTIAHNRTAELSEWNKDILKLELDDLSDFDFDFHFDFDEDEEEYTPPDYNEETQERVERILNLDIANYKGVGDFDIPAIKGVKKMPDVKEWIGFNQVLSDNNPQGKGVHFFVDDYQFERVWNNPDKYIDKLREYEAVLSPDFSPYGDMPLITQLFNHYRKHWCAAYWQENGINVIPTVRSSTDKRFLKYFTDGEPTNSIICYSTMWADMDAETAKIARLEYKAIIERLKPKKIIVYGKILPFMDDTICERIPTFLETRFER